jgi:hypothetical protein
LFTNAELQNFADSISKSLAMGDLLGRARIHQRMISLGGNPKPGELEGVSTFADVATASPGGDLPTPRSQILSTSPTFFTGRIEPLPPDQAIAFFESLVPTLVIQPELFTAGIRREAFTLAVSSEQTLTENVKQIILDSLKNGTGSRAGAIAIEETLADAGVSPLHSQYSEMVYRTNALGAYNQGAADELQNPVIDEFFPVWEYIGIHDGRDRARHTVHFGKFFPNSITFTDVRDSEAGKFDGYNCRCTFRPVSKYEWRTLQEKGATLQSL